MEVQLTQRELQKWRKGKYLNTMDTIYIYIHTCVCERERERKSETGLHMNERTY
jgi:hypothetical protein